MKSNENIAVIGGGMTGSTAALRLAQAGHSVTLYEASDHLGGLSDSYTWNGITWDRFYHVVLSTDTKLIGILEELGLDDELFWKETKSGFYGEGKLVSMSNMGDFLTFPFLSLWQKFRLGFGILRSTRTKDTDRLDKIFVREWLIRMFGRRVYERMWDPLLRSKLGDNRNKTSAAFIWATINRLYGARSGEAKTEKMGHVRGGYATILTEMKRLLETLGVDINLGKAVDAVVAAEDGVLVKAAGVESLYDKVLLTVPSPEVLRLIGNATSDDSYWKALQNVHYLGVLCQFLVLDRQLSPYYVTNLLDTTLPFTGIIEVTNIIDPSHFEGRHIVYLPKYVSLDDPAWDQPDEVVTERFIQGLKKVHPQLSNDAIQHTRLFRERFVQPLQELNYLDETRGIATPLPNVFLANSTMLYNSTLNNNAAISLAEEAVSIIEGEC